MKAYLTLKVAEHHRLMLWRGFPRSTHRSSPKSSQHTAWCFCIHWQRSLCFHRAIWSCSQAEMLVGFWCCTWKSRTTFPQIHQFVLFYSEFLSQLFNHQCLSPPVLHSLLWSFLFRQNLLCHWALFRGTWSSVGPSVGPCRAPLPSWRELTACASSLVPDFQPGRGWSVTWWHHVISESFGMSFAKCFLEIWIDCICLTSCVCVFLTVW